jgi:hypothetical protein
MFLFFTGAVIGTLLGLRYKVFVLVPATGVAIAIVALGGIANSAGFGQTVVRMIAIGTILQLGYGLGNIIELLLVERLRTTGRKYSVSQSARPSKSA